MYTPPLTWPKKANLPLFVASLNCGDTCNGTPVVYVYYSCSVFAAASSSHHLKKSHQKHQAIEGIKLNVGTNLSVQQTLVPVGFKTVPENQLYCTRTMFAFSLLCLHRLFPLLSHKSSLRFCCHIRAPCQELQECTT